MITGRSPLREFTERTRVRDALSAWREKLIARGHLDGDKHYDAIERHARAVWSRESHPTISVPAVVCERCGARRPVDGPCVSCGRVRA